MAWNEPGPGRDPWSSNSGGRRGEGPPDLDALLKKLKSRFSGGRSGRGGSGSLPPGLIGVGALIVIVLWLMSGFYTVEEQERAVVLRFGAFVETTEPGLRWHLPWPVERVERIPFTQIRQVTDRATMLTQDENLVDLELSVQYRVSSVQDYLFSLADPDRTLQQASKAAVREVVGRSQMDFILTDGRQAVADRTKQLLQERLDDYHAGLIVTEVNLQQAQPPDQVQAAFADAIKAREDKERARNEAEAYANDRLPRARGEAARRIAEATAYRDQTIARAEGDAARFSALLTAYKQAPKITRSRMYYDALSEIYASNPKLLLDDDKGGQGVVLPLGDWLKGLGLNGGAAASPSGGAARTTASPSADDAPLPRDRSR